MCFQSAQRESVTTFRTPLAGRSNSSTGGNRKRPTIVAKTPPAKRLKKDGGPGYDCFPSDEFLFSDLESNREEIMLEKETTLIDKEETFLTQSVKEEEEEEEREQSEREETALAKSKKWNRAVCGDKNVTEVVQALRSREELEALEKEMSSNQLYLFRQAYLLAGNHKPRFIPKSEVWSRNPRVFRVGMTLGVLYLALLYTNQPVLPVDIARLAYTHVHVCTCKYTILCVTWTFGGYFVSIISERKLSHS